MSKTHQPALRQPLISGYRSLFENVCTCGNVYEECTEKCSKCPAFKFYQNEMQKRLNELDKLNNLKK